MIFIKNKQKKIKIDEKALKDDIKKLLLFLGYKDYDISVWFTTNQTIRKYNKNFRQIDRATDILSFPYYTELESGEKISPPEDPEDKNLGDIIISLEFCKKVAGELGVSLKQHLRVLIVHGISHLLGFDHKSDSQYKKMKIFEENLLKRLD